MNTLKRIFSIIFWSGLTFLFIILVRPMNYYPFVLLQSLAVVFIIMYMTLVGYFMLRKRKRALLYTTVLTLLLLNFYMPHLVHHPPRSKAQGTAELSVAHFNVFRLNKNHKKTIDAAIKSKATVISFQEVDSAWTEALDCGLLASYPYRHSYASDTDCYGLAVYSKVPLSDVQQTEIHGSRWLSGKLTLRDTTIRFITAHLSSPTTELRFRQRNEQLVLLRTVVGAESMPTVVFGDFNTVPWDDNFKSLLLTTGLKTSRTNYHATYPAWSPIPVLPIDFILHSSHMKCNHFETISSTSSDHFGIKGSYIL